MLKTFHFIVWHFLQRGDAVLYSNCLKRYCMRRTGSHTNSDGEWELLSVVVVVAGTVWVSTRLYEFATSSFTPAQHVQVMRTWWKKITAFPFLPVSMSAAWLHAPLIGATPYRFTAVLWFVVKKNVSKSLCFMSVRYMIVFHVLVSQKN